MTSTIEYEDQTKIYTLFPDTVYIYPSSSNNHFDHIGVLDGSADQQQSETNTVFKNSSGLPLLFLRAYFPPSTLLTISYSHNIHNPSIIIPSTLNTTCILS